MKICVLTADLTHGGASLVARDVARGMAARGHAVRLVCSGERDRRRLEAAVEVVVLGQAARRRAYQFVNPELVVRLARELRDFGPDVLHIHNVNLRSFSLSSLLLSTSLPTVWTLHDVWPLCLIGWPEPPGSEGMRDGCRDCQCGPRWQVRLNKWLKELTYRAVRLDVVCPSQWMAELIRVSRLARQPVHVVPNGVDTVLFAPARERSERGAPRLLFTGGKSLADRLPAERKGWRVLVEALRVVAPQFPGLSLEYVGDPLAVGPDFPVPIEWFAGVDRTDMPAHYRRADALVLPTLADNQPLTVLEAMACGTPVVSSRAGGLPEMVEEGVTGWLAQTGSGSDLARALATCLQADRRAVAARAREVAVRRYGLAVMLDGYEGVYEAARLRHRARSG